MFSDNIFIDSLETPKLLSFFYLPFSGYGKKITDIKDAYQHAVQKAGHTHRERRKFLRTALKEMGLIFVDQPGLLGPKALLVFMGLAYARDEVLWLTRHNDNPPQNKAKGMFLVFEGVLSA